MKVTDAQYKGETAPGGLTPTLEKEGRHAGLGLLYTWLGVTLPPPPSDELSRAVARLNVIPVASISHMSETAVGDDLAAHKEIVEAVEATTSYFNFLF